MLSKLTRLNPTKILGVVLISILLLLFAQLVLLSMSKVFAIDELTYAHAAWLVSKGQLPWHDFFEIHVPLLYQLLSVVFTLNGDDPTLITTMRWLMLGPVLLTMWSMWRVNHDDSGIMALCGPILALLIVDHVIRWIEIRPDVLAFSLILTAAALPYMTRPGPKIRAVLAGATFALACWTTQKVYYYGSVFIAAWIADMLLWQKTRSHAARYILGQPIWFAAGALIVVLGAMSYLTLTGTWAEWWKYTIAWGAHHQDTYPGFSWHDHSFRLIQDYWWILIFSTIGLVTTIRKLGNSSDTHPTDQLLVGLLVSTFLSVSIQQAAFAYSYIPVVNMCCIFAARGMMELWHLSRSASKKGSVSPVFVTFACLLLIAFMTHRVTTKLAKQAARTNEYQLSVLKDINRLTDPGDTIYDNSGSFVSRPHAYFMYYTDAGIRKSQATELANEVPQHILSNQTVAELRDTRFNGLPQPLKLFLRTHFQPYSGDIKLWGSRFESTKKGSFIAVTQATYFVEPAAVVTSGELLIDGVVVGDTFDLSRGEHTVEYRGTIPDYYILWMPRDGNRWRPVEGARARFSVVF
ncbi:MAG: hypothetical protein ACI9GW_001643 [Halieaceae bacterium]|jgi:hypothetical protein